MIRSGYKLSFEELLTGDATLGQIGVLPWDTETFGFPVATYKTGASQLEAASRRKLGELFRKWIVTNRVLLCSCSVPAEAHFWKECLPALGFQFVDVGLKASLNGLRSAVFPQARSELRKAERKDWEQIEAIANTSFHHGRYHADPLFPRRLADVRYRDWIRRALSEEHSHDHVYVMGDAGAVTGFYHVTIEGDVSDLRLAAVSKEMQGTMLGFDLYVSILEVLKNAGVRKVVTSVSPINTGVMNVYAMLGFRFSEPEAIYHWHAAGGEPK